MNKICLISNYASAYRTAIYVEMNKQLGCDFFFGDKCLDIKKMDYNLLTNVTEGKNIKIGPCIWQKGAIRQFLKSYDSFIVLGQLDFMSTWVILLLSKFSSKMVYLWAHGWYGRENFIKTVIKKIFFKLADGLFIYGDYAIELMKNEGFKADKLHAIHNSLDYDKQIAIRKNINPSEIYQDHFKNANPNLIFIGRLTSVKRLDMILDALRMLKERNIEYNLTYIGTGEDLERLQKIVTDYKLDNNVWFYGASYQESELSELIYNADVCISPGNVGLTAIHCLTYGCPVITHNNFPMQMPEFEVVKSGVTGDFFECNNIDSLADTINNWFSISHNREYIRLAAYKIIDESWNPHYQIVVLKKALLK